MRSHDETAERIIKTHGLNFALAVAGKSAESLALTRCALKNFSRTDRDRAIAEFGDVLSADQIGHIRDRNEDFWIIFYKDRRKEAQVCFIDDEG